MNRQYHIVYYSKKNSLLFNSNEIINDMLEVISNKYVIYRVVCNKYIENFLSIYLFLFKSQTHCNTYKQNPFIHFHNEPMPALKKTFLAGLKHKTYGN